MEAVDALKSVLCGPDGKCCIAGSQADRDTVDTALAAIQNYLDQHKAGLPVLPELDQEDQQWLTDNPNTSDIVAFIRGYATGHGQQCAAHARELALEEMVVDFERRAACVSSKAGYSEGLRNGYLGAATAIEVLKGK